MNKTKSLLMIILPLILVFGLYFSVIGLEKPPLVRGPVQGSPSISLPQHPGDEDMHTNENVPLVNPGQQAPLPGETEAEQFLKELSNSFIADMPAKPPYNGPENIPTGKQGGEDVGSAVAITTIPGTLTGTTSGYADDYDEVCPYGPHESPDVVYSYTPSVDETLDISLCNSAYDTKMFVYEDAVTAGTPYACNDDDPACPGYQSSIYGMDVLYGHTYYIVIDGYDGDFGDYQLDLSYYEEPDDFVCPPGAFTEAEPCGDDTNGGCNMTVPYFEPIDCGDTVCGTVWADGGTRDTDWYQLTLTAPTIITWTATAEFTFVIGVVDTSDCALAAALDPYATGNPGDVVSCSRIAGPGNYWLFVSHQAYEGNPCGTANGYWAAIDCEVITEGACCDPATGDCTPDVEEAPCLAMYGATGVWMGGYSCDPNPCTQPATPGDDCSNPYTVTIPAELPFANSNSTCGRLDDYNETCMGYYDGGEDMIYEIVVTSDVYVAITMDPLGYTYSGIGLDDACPFDATTCLAVVANSTTDLRVIEMLLTAGTYYLMIDSWPSPACIDFSLTIEAIAEPVGRCCYGEPTAPDCDDLIASECAATGTMISWDSDKNCTDNPCVAITPGDDCSDPMEVKLPGDMPYVNSNYTCGRGNMYDATCLGYYDGGEDIIYWLDVDAACDIDVAVDPGTTTYVGVLIATDCPPDSFNCVAYASVGYSGGVVEMLGVHLEPGSYYLMVDTWPSPACIEEFTLSITAAAEGEVGDNCTNPIEIKVPEDLTYVTNDSTCGRSNHYSETCMGSYDGGEDIIYELDVDANVKLNFTVDGLGTTYIGMGLDDTCPLDATCIAYASASGGFVEMSADLTPGFYYLMIDTYPSPNCIPLFELTIEEDTCTPPPNDFCEDVTPVTLTDGVAYTFSGDNTCASGGDCSLLTDNGHAWEAFTIDTLSNVTVDYCLTDPNFDLIYIVLADACPCDAGSGALTFADATDWTLCGGNGNVTMWFDQLPAGTWYMPVLSDHPDYPHSSYYYEGPYDITVLAEATEATYCSGSGGCDEYIENVTVESINNTTACDGYGDFTGQIAYMAYSVGYPITITVGNGYSSDVGGVWVDWNQDQDWDDPGEAITLDVSSGYGPYTGTITPPVDALAGPTRMRVRLCYGCTLDPCGATSYGEVEDYTILVGGTPSTFTVDPAALDLGTVPVDATGSGSLTLGAVGSLDITFSIAVDYDKFGGHSGGNFNLGTMAPEKAPASGQSSPPSQNVIRQGGDDVASAVAITSDVSVQTGTTVGYTNDYDEVCDYTGSTAPDVVYSYACTADNKQIDVDMFGSLYDTKIYIYEDAVTAGAPYACNDDYYSDYTSALFNVDLTNGSTYYIVIDGYGTEEGEYTAAVTVHDAANPFECPPGAISEGEACGDDTNGGCNMATPTFEPYVCGDTVCGTVWADGGTRDTDWYVLTMFQNGPVTFTGSANFPFIIGFVDTIDCALAASLDPYALGNPNDVVSVTKTVGPGQYILFVSHQVYEGYPCGTENDYWMTADCDPGVAPILWLDPQPISGVIPGDGSFPITVNYDVAGLDLGIHTANLNITHTGVKGFTVVPVTINVGGGNNITLVDPDPISAAMAHTQGDSMIVATIYLGGAFAGGGYVVEDIDLAEPLTITGSVGSMSAYDPVILPSLEGFTGSVLQMTADMSDLIACFPLMWDTEVLTFTIGGTFNGGAGFTQDAEFTAIGHTSGDANFDGVVNIFDISYNIAYLYKGGPEPQPILLTGDANGDGVVNVLDVARLISFLYKGGVAPTHQ